jgi:alkylresorcinol/alkylpyrone synthase
MTHPVAVLSLATASPPYTLLQTDVAAVARDLFQDSYPNFELLAPVFATAGIRERQAIRPIEWYQQPLDWPKRSEAYLAGGIDLFIDCATKALDEAGLRGSEVDIIVTVSSTGIATPSLEAHAMTQMGFRPDVLRVPVFGLGCAGGVSGLGIAARLAAATPGAVVLLVVVEVCTLAFRTEDLTKADIVATALFGDGAAACVLRAGGEGFADITACAQHTWPETLDIMGWRVDPTGLGVIFARSIPPFARDHLRDAMVSMLQGGPVAFDDVDRFICHPGG